ncbi:MAG: PSD1 and planctomycete cytochrome C domain-containing protein [Isosphaeraceae bacterium]
MQRDILREIAGYLSTASFGLLLAAGFAIAGDGPRSSSDRSKPVDFDAEVRPILARACLKCHGPEKARGGLRLDSHASAMAGGDSGEPAVKPGDTRASTLLERIGSEDPRVRMPSRANALASDEIALFSRWVAEGAPWPETHASAATPVKSSEMVVTDIDREHWSFRPLRPVAPPEVTHGGWVRNPIDRFLLAKQEAKGLAPTSEADRRTLIRRLTFDLVGLPPTHEAVEAFARGQRSDDYERMVDRLLASPQYGERWGRHWLDVARYADSDGYEGDRDRPHAYRYRNFVIRALNADMPFDRFVRWQIAGDQYEPDDADALAATGFCTAAPSQETTPADTDENKAKIRYDELDNMLATAGSGLLGLTIGCARCHDHKFDPIPTRDYYRMLAAFTNSMRREAPLSRPHRDLELWIEEQRRLYREDAMQKLGLTDAERFWLRQPEHFFIPVQIALYKKYGKALDPSTEALRTWLDESKRAEWKVLERRAAEAKSRGADPSVTGLILLDRGPEPEASYLLGRGSITVKKDVVTLGFLQVLSRGRTPEEHRSRAMARAHSGGRNGLGTTYRRAAMAQWLTDVNQGAGALLARVIVNRLWQHHHGDGLVRTPDDFGRTGDSPRHPELLEWLASELIRNDWRLKPIHRLIVTSAAYRQGSAQDPRRPALDPDDRLLTHRRPIRLEAEAIRDAMLAASGRLNGRMFGPPFRPRIPAAAISTRSKDAYPADIAEGPDIWRRSVYAFIKRSVVNPFAETFDAPDSTATCGRRNITTVPTQNLAILNDPFVRGCARDLARRATSEAGPAPADRVRRAYELALGRPPRDGELAAAREFLGAGDGPESFVDLCHVLFTLNEFIDID